MDYIIVVWNEILQKILDKGRNLGTSLVIENHVGVKNAACSQQGRGARRLPSPCRGTGEPGGTITSHGMRGQGSPFLWVPVAFSRGTPHPAWPPVPLTISRAGAAAEHCAAVAAGTEWGHGHPGCEGLCKCLLMALEDRGAFV